ncbi:hypothetical protein FP435_03460 [Lactobacillus sp. PV037]|uniref:hypothetical protein n=1 Tax=unclassified Lactobacillus TaxID=2620435 RepID=UPI002240E2DD|nr:MULTISPECIES: hypothetical protein [unclassified Lactobacillus]QNQ82322.1 hypothetical protein FP433_04370 [Lactobacillus sp. PV012]QNQ83566.1 hypothetical protein FP435_03460 [Lactobacillus sp. PV037]
MKKKYLGLVVAALLGVTPLTGVVANSIHPNIVQAADDDDQTATLWLKKKTPYLVAKNGETVGSLALRPVSDVTSNVSKVTKMLGMSVYANMDNGDPDYTEALSVNTPLRKGKSYSAVLTFNVKNGSHYSRLLQQGNWGNYVGKEWSLYVWDTGDNGAPEPHIVSGDKMDLGYEGRGNENAASIVVPIKVENNTSASSVKKVNLKGYVRGRKNAKVTTYTSTGKTTRTKVYGHHTYKLNQKKTIKGKTYYKVYGKSYWIRATSLVIK